MPFHTRDQLPGGEEGWSFWVNTYVGAQRCIWEALKNVTLQP